MTEVLNADGSAHESNARAKIDDDDNDFWFDLNKNILLWMLIPLYRLSYGRVSRSKDYCSVGGKNTHGRHLVEEHADICIEAALI